MKTFLKITISFLLIILTLTAIGFFIIYPNYPKIKLFINSVNAQDIARNSSLKIFTRISQPISEDTLIKAEQALNMENIDEAALTAYKNSGKTIYNIEKESTVLEVASADIKGRVFDGNDTLTMLKGFWHFPFSSAPDRIGNTVIIAHRYDKMPPAQDTFFNLDKVSVGDKIKVTQKNNEYTYTVVSVRAVAKDDRSVLMDTSDYRITLITCTPLWSNKQRLVVVGKLDKSYGNI